MCLFILVPPAPNIGPAFSPLLLYFHICSSPSIEHPFPTVYLVYSSPVTSAKPCVAFSFVPWTHHSMSAVTLLCIPGLSLLLEGEFPEGRSCTAHLYIFGGKQSTVKRMGSALIVGTRKTAVFFPIDCVEYE